MNRRQFLGLSTLVLVSGCHYEKQVPTAPKTVKDIPPIYTGLPDKNETWAATRGTYAQWSIPGVPFTTQ